MSFPVLTQSMLARQNSVTDGRSLRVRRKRKRSSFWNETNVWAYFSNCSTFRSLSKLQDSELPLAQKIPFCVTDAPPPECPKSENARDSRMKPFSLEKSSYEEAMKRSVKQFASICNAGVRFLRELEEEGRRMEELRDALRRENSAVEKKIEELKEAKSRLKMSWDMMQQKKL